MRKKQEQKHQQLSRTHKQNVQTPFAYTVKVIVHRGTHTSNGMHSQVDEISKCHKQWANTISAHAYKWNLHFFYSFFFFVSLAIFAYLAAKFITNKQTNRTQQQNHHHISAQMKIPSFPFSFAFHVFRFILIDSSPDYSAFILLNV